MKDRSWLSQLIIQPIMIVLSILAALAVNNWQESRTLAKHVADARAAFTNEIQANKDLLLSENYLPHHRHLQSEYEKIVKGEAADSGAFFETGVHPAPLRDSAWRMLSGSAILLELPSELVLALSDIYRAQDSIEKDNHGFLSAIIVPRSDRDTPAYAKDVALSIRLYLNDLVPAEERLVRNYDHTLARLASEKAPWADGKEPAKK
jgi:hypothetical protein